MPRTKRILGDDGFNHCIIRGIDKGDIFFDNQDRKKFLKEVKKFKEKNDVKIGTYALMPNHVHFLMKGNGEYISSFFHSLLISYSSYFNKKYDRVGHLFENRYKNKVVDDDVYLKHLVKYIHYNPEKAGICRFYDYEWSGYKELLADETWLDKDLILMYYSDDISEAKKQLTAEHLVGLNKYYEDYVEYEMVHRLTDEQVKKIITEKMADSTYTIENLLSKQKNNKILKEVLGIKGVSVNQVNRVTGINRRFLTKLKDEIED